MECPALTEIAIVWNNDDDPIDHDFVKRQHWLRPIYFNKTPHNSMDYRYNLPVESKASVFFSMDDDVNTTCQQLMKSFKIYQQNSIGDLGPIVSFGTRGFDFQSRRENFKYMDPLKAKYYSMSLIGISWISRFYMQIYTSTKSWEVNQIREIVRRKNNCDDIALNYIINFFFPEFRTIYSQAEYHLSVFPDSQGKSSTHYKYRNECLKQFTDIFGFNPLRLVSRAGQKNESRFESLTDKYSVYLKRKETYEKLIKGDNIEQQKLSFEASATQQIDEMEKTLKQNVSQKPTQKATIQGKALQKISKELEQQKLKSQQRQEQRQKIQEELNKNQQQIKSIRQSFLLLKVVSLIVGLILVAIVILSNLYLISSRSQSSTSNQHIQINSEGVEEKPNPE